MKSARGYSLRFKGKCFTYFILILRGYNNDLGFISKTQLSVEWSLSLIHI